MNKLYFEATNAGIPVIGISNTDNITSKIDLYLFQQITEEENL